MSSYHLHLLDQHLELLPHKSIFWRNKNTLILSDLHLGKASHFRKHGLALPQESGMQDLLLLESLLTETQPERLLILGDLFHSTYNTDWEHFGELRQKFDYIPFDLVPGNHDILQKKHYERFNISFLPNFVEEESLIFSHVPMEVEKGRLNISGHIHPGFYLEGKARNSLKLPCFYMHGQMLILPAFGKLTGLKMMAKPKEAEVFVVTGKAVHKI